ncbi:MAG: hypothetical protein RQ723_12040 [Desulfuromonadales bacterium]|nr:hypothetical protein [Desulfuromonadales bacterium]
MARQVEVEFRGLDDAVREIRRMGQAAIDEVPGALLREGERIMARSKNEVPVDTGTLRSSGHVEGPAKRGLAAEVTLAYGGPSAQYAAVVHEKHRTASKYLERPMRTAAATMGRRIAADIRRALDRAARRGGGR